MRGKNIGRFFIDFDNLYVYYNYKILHRARDEKIFLKPEKLIMQTISSNLTVAYDNQNYYPLSTCIAIIPKEGVDEDISIKYLLLLMNSNVMNFYYDFIFNLGAHLTTEISVKNISRLPLKLLNDYATFNILADLMIQMNSTDTLRKQNKDFILFLDDLLNLLIIEIMFLIKFQADSLNTDLINKVSQYLIKIELSSMNDIQECIKKMQNDEELGTEMLLIKNHPWVKTIEEYFNK